MSRRRSLLTCQRHKARGGGGGGAATHLHPLGLVFGTKFLLDCLFYMIYDRAEAVKVKTFSQL